MGSWGQQQCEVLAADPGKSISFLFSEGVRDTTITWPLEPVDGGTVLHHEHRIPPRHPHGQAGH
ncbi:MULTISPECIES: SRPBCC domain-containing protein [unclassified Arthrobacter]|uniref:SRPBCC family protein n=1 Tax=unclassified Arthrobacter TaxID=235627 RepID=UPI001F0F0FDD|nr:MULTISPECIES: hypothetical protein [unclassified Arthrobacter]